jgi:radical SAM superfamily enzyme YgiQ (UPF0313 family)
MSERTVTLVYLPHPHLKQPDAQAPIGLLYLAAVLERIGIHTNIHNSSASLTPESVIALPETDIYGISVTAMELPQANRYARLIKERFPYCKVLLGGPGTFSDEYIDWSVVDSICKGEGEITILKMLEDIDQDNLLRRYMGESVKNLDTLPFPARDHMGAKQGGNIFAYNKNYKGKSSTIILSSRGCPYQCSFCGSPKFTKNSSGVRYRSPENVIAEIKECIEKYGIYQFRFSDDMFTANKQRVLEFCKLVKSLDIVWRISCRVNPFDLETAQALFDSGCKEVSLGVESFDDNVLKVLNKKSTAEDNARALNICRAVGITTRVLFMIRTPGQTEDTVDINIEWLEKVPYDIIACTSFVPIPGSDIWDHPYKYNIQILNKNLDDYNFYFFGKHGENELLDIIKIKDRSLQEFNTESQQFRDYLKQTGRLNEG